jgi:hypothetical protein
VTWFLVATGSILHSISQLVLITVIAYNQSGVSAPPIVSATLNSYSYVGYPIVVPIVMSVPSASPMTLSITVKGEVNGSLLNYSSAYNNYSISPRVIQIGAGISEVNFTILYFNSTVPPGITLLLSLSSLYPLYHILTTPTLYVSFFRDAKYQGLYPPMKVVVSTTYQSNANDIGKSVLNVFVNNQTQSVSFAPVIISMNQI